ncbi:MAG: sugar phosphate isomerase/epimerase family protein [Faecousia sp.]
MNFVCFDEGVIPVRLCIRAHDLGVKGSDAILDRLEELGLDGVQMVCYKAYEDIPYAPGGITEARAEEIGQAFRSRNAAIPLVGAYFNPVHSNREKAARCADIFADYLRCCRLMGCEYVGSETGSYNDEPWIYHPQNRTEEALQAVVATFSRLCDIASDCGSTVAMEGAAGHVCWDVDTLARARRMMGRKTKVIFDLYNFMDASNQGDYLTILDKGLDTFAGEILLFHMKDCLLQNGAAPRQVPFGTGDLDLEAILRKIKAYDNQAVLTLEGTTGEHIRHAVTVIKDIWERV